MTLRPTTWERVRRVRSSSKNPGGKLMHRISCLPRPESRGSVQENVRRLWVFATKVIVHLAQSDVATAHCVAFVWDGLRKSRLHFDTARMDVRVLIGKGELHPHSCLGRTCDLIDCDICNLNRFHDNF